MGDRHTIRGIGEMRRSSTRRHISALIIVDGEMRVRWANSDGRELLAIDEKYSNGPRLQDLHWPQGVLDPALTVVESAASEGVRVQRTVQPPGTVTSWQIEASPIRVTEDDVFVIALSISAERQRDVVSLDDPLWRLLFDSIPHPILILDDGHRVVAANRATLALLGVDDEEQIVGQFCYHLFHSAPTPPANCPSVALREDLSREQKQAEMDVLGRKMMISVSPVSASDGSLRYVIHDAVDVTCHRAAEATASLFLDILGHDVANLIQSIEMALWLIDQEGGESESAKIIRDAVSRIGRLIEKSRDIESLPHSPLRPLVLQDAVRASVERLLTRFPDVVVDVSLPTEDCTIDANRYISVILDNLLDNAVRHNPSDHRRVWVRIEKSNRGCKLVIADNGPGLDSTMRRTLLNGSRHFGGIGVHQARIVSARFGATLRIEDRIDGRPDEGSAFVIWFPAALQTA